MRTFLVAALAAAALLAVPPADAGVSAQVVDPAGDVALGGTAAHDIVSLTVETTRSVTTKKVGGRTVRTTMPKDWVVTMRLAAAPDPAWHVRYTLIGQSEDCGYFDVETTGGSAAAATGSGLAAGSVRFARCDGKDVREPIRHTMRVHGASIVWTVPYAALPVPAGTPYQLVVVTGLCAVDGECLGYRAATAYDNAYATRPYLLGS